MSERARAYGPTVWQNEYAREVAATAKRYRRERNPEIRMAHAETLRRLTDDLISLTLGKHPAGGEHPCGVQPPWPWPRPKSDASA